MLVGNILTRLGQSILFIYFHLQETENDLKALTGWGTKLVEKPGTPLLTVFIKSFPMEDGCVRGKECMLCDNKGGNV